MDRPFRERIVGRSRLTISLREELARAAARDDGVLLIGEAGAGKELGARTIHHLSFRKKGPFRAVDCARFFPDDLSNVLFGSEERPHASLLARCDGGTLYLLHPEDLVFSTQERLVAFLRSGTFLAGEHGPPQVADVRVIAGTERDLARYVRSGLFLQELWDELSASVIKVPPLRERLEDIEAVLELVAGWPAAERFTPEAVQALARYPWPGNYDELIEEIQRLLRTGYGQIEVQHLRRDIVEHDPSSVAYDPEILQVLREIDQLIAAFQLRDGVPLDFSPYFWRGGPVPDEEEPSDTYDWDCDYWETDMAW